MRCVASTPALQTRQGGEVRKVCGVSPSPWKRGLTLGDLRPKFYVPSGIVWLTECEALDFSCAQHISGEEAMLHARKQEASELKPLTADDFRDVMQSTSDLRSNFRLPCASCLTSKMTFHQFGFRGVPFPSRLTFAQTIIHADVASVSAPEIFGGTLFLFGSRSSPRRSGPDLCADRWALSAFFFLHASDGPLGSQEAGDRHCGFFREWQSIAEADESWSRLKGQTRSGYAVCRASVFGTPVWVVYNTKPKRN